MKNHYETNGEVTKIYLSNCDEFMLIDTEDFERMSQHTWHKDGEGYGGTSVNNKHVRCHNFLLGKTPKGLVTDHINRNKLDNRKSNLRFCSYFTNVHNRDRYKGKPKKFEETGIRYRHGLNTDTYSVELFDHGKTYYVGSYRTLEQAIAVRREAFDLLCKGELTPFQIKKLRNAQ